MSASEHVGLIVATRAAVRGITVDAVQVETVDDRIIVVLRASNRSPIVFVLKQTATDKELEDAVDTTVVRLHELGQLVPAASQVAATLH